MGEDAIIVAIVFGSILGMIVIPMFFNLAKKWIERNNNSYDEQAFDRLAKAFIQYKKESERRFQHLEAIIAEDDTKASSRAERSSAKNLKKEQLHNTIEIEEHESEPKDKKKDSGNGNLRNMLKE